MSKTIIVTGGSRGIGRAAAILCGRRGWNVVVNYVGAQDAARETAREVEAAGGKALVVQGDVAVEADVKRLFAECDARFGALDGLVNNAGIVAPVGPFTGMDLAHAVAPVELLVGSERRSFRKFFVGHQRQELVGFDGRIVFHARPWQRAIVFTDSEKATETQNGIGDVTADLVDHQPLDTADLSAVGIEHPRAFDAIAGDETMRFLIDCVRIHERLQRGSLSRRTGGRDTRDTPHTANPPFRARPVTRARRQGSCGHHPVLASTRIT